ncbi:MAG: hypothetical protein ACJ759_18595 [Thermoanaerobaculia bacterium]
MTALETSLLLLLEAVLNPIWAWLAHGERPGAWSIAGGLLILVATPAKSAWDARRVQQAAWLSGRPGRFSRLAGPSGRR